MGKRVLKRAIKIKVGIKENVKEKCMRRMIPNGLEFLKEETNDLTLIVERVERKIMCQGREMVDENSREVIHMK